MKILKNIGAAVLGMAAGAICVSLVQMISNTLYPPPADLDFDDREKLTEWIMTLPTSAYLFVLVSWAAGATVGPFVARITSPGRAALPAVIVWLLFGVATFVTLSSIPHPWWMWPAGVGIWLMFGFLGMAFSAPTILQVAVSRTIQSPLPKVFETIARPDRFCEAIPDIIQIEIISDQKYGVGTRFRETRNMNGKTAVAEMTVSEQVENQLVRLVAEMGGADWDTCFRLSPLGKDVQLDMIMIARPKTLFAKFLTPLIMGMVGKAVGSDMDQVKIHCEKLST